MNMPEIIAKKVANQELSKEEIHYFISGYVDGTIPDYQASALLMSIVFNGMSARETANLTEEMMHSGDIVDLSPIKGIVVDKHSTGGVGDKTSLVVLPMVAACGAKVAKLSGRGLGHTGGTVDKLESIPGFTTQIGNEEFMQLINRVGLSIVSQTDNLVPADKKLYALRDVTGTVNSIPLIASSIMSKKLATGSQGICLDVKYGSGAFCETTEKAVQLSQAMIDIGKHMGRDVRAVITNMDEPLGFAVGNILEVVEAINTLNGKGPEDLWNLSLEAGVTLLLQAKIYDNPKDAEWALKEVVKSGKALDKLAEFVTAQRGDASYIYHPEKFAVAKYEVPVRSDKEGYIQHINAEGVGEAARKLGAGRLKKEDSIDFTAGIILRKKVADYVKANEIIATLYTNDKNAIEEVKKDMANCYQIGKEKGVKQPLIYKVLS